MSPKRKGGMKVTLHRVEDGLRRLFRSRDHKPAEVQPKNESSTYLNNLDWDGLRQLRVTLDANAGAFGPLTSTIDQLSRCIEVFEHQAKAREEYRKLGADLNDLFHVLARRFEIGPASITLESIGKFARSVDEETKLLKSDEYKRSENDGSITEDVDDVLRCYRRVRTLLALFVDTRLEQVPHSPEAHNCAFGANDLHRTGCMPTTRAGVLQDLREWVHYGKFQKVYCLNGIPGTGKTTIAYSLCEYLEDSGKPAASFFCSRDSLDCRDVKRILPSVSYQLARLSRPFRCTISGVLGQGSEVYNQSIDEQFETLLTMPLQNVGHTFGTDVVIVIDALEECEDEDGVNRILDACFRVPAGLPLRFFITTRPNSGISRRMRASQSGYSRAELRLHEVDRAVAQEDVRTYLKVKLERLALSDDEIGCLAQRSGGWFLYAASIVDYITQDNVSGGAGRPKRLLDILSFSETNTNRDIDILYTAMIEETADRSALSDSRRAEIMLVLRTAACAREPLTMNAVAGLLRLDFDLVHAVLRPLLPALHVPNKGELGMVLHESFAGYLVDPRRSGRFHSDVQRDNVLLAKLCFEAISVASPPFNVCNLESSYLLDREVADLDERVNESISQSLWYACRHWATHLKLAGRSDDLLAALHDFLSTRLLLWMEVMNLKHRISEAVELLHGLHAWLQEAECPVKIVDLGVDAWMFVVAFSSSEVSESTPHIYVSALRFWPSHRPVAGQYAPMLRNVAKATGFGLERRGKDPIVFGDPVARAARRSQSSDVINVYPWDVDTGAPVHRPLQGHREPVHSVVYSPDGAFIMSASHDRTIRIWDAHTGQLVGQPLLGNGWSLHSVAYSPNGAYIASGYDDSSISIWNASTGQLVARHNHPTFRGTSLFQSVAYSPNGAYIVSGSEDGTVHIWDAHTGQRVGRPLRGHANGVTSVSYSLNNAFIVSGSFDMTIRIWDTHSGQAVGRPLYGHTSWVQSVAYSPDGAYIVSGSSDKTVRIWDARTGRLVGRPLEGHTDEVESVAYSPDGGYIVSGSHDTTIRIWDAHTGRPAGQPLQGHAGAVLSVAYSPDGACIVSGSRDRTIRIWDAVAGRETRLVEAPAQQIRSLARFPNPLSTFSAFAQSITRNLKKPSTPAVNNPRIPAGRWNNL